MAARGDGRGDGGSDGLRIAVQLALGLVIIVLAYWLYASITGPYEAVERQQEATRLTRERMERVRTALNRYRSARDRFPGSLDSLVVWLQSDPAGMEEADSLLGYDFHPDSLIHSPRTGKRFVYLRKDTAGVSLYLLKDPDSNDHIGSEEPDVTLLNAASWE